MHVMSMSRFGLTDRSRSTRCLCVRVCDYARAFSAYRFTAQNVYAAFQINCFAVPHGFVSSALFFSAEHGE